MVALLSMSTVLVTSIALAALIYLFAWLRQRTGPPTIHKRLGEWLGPKYAQLEVHDKSFPGYDIASVRRALDSFIEDRCGESSEVGATVAVTLRELFETLKSPNFINMRPGAYTFERVPIDVGEEASFPANVLWLCTLSRNVTGAAGERIALLMAARTPDFYELDSLDSRHAPRMQIWVSIACTQKSIADDFFKEIERRRRTESVYRGKVIDPVVDAGGIRTIGFRAIQNVEAENLVLPDKVNELLISSMLQFYKHSALLEEFGIEKKRGVLLHGPPGTGKTSICLSLAKKLSRFTICFVSGERLLYPRELCRMARYLQPTMIVFEDIDLIAGQRDINGLATVLGELMNQIDGCDPGEEVLFVMNTNSLERLESAVKNRPGRVDQIIEVPLPDAEDRRRLIERFAGKATLKIERWESLLEATKGVTPAMMKEIVKRAKVSALEQLDPEAPKASQLVVDEGGLLLAVQQVRLMRDRTPDARGSIGFGA